MSNDTEKQSNQQILSIGSILRKKREELHLSLDDVSKALRIRLSFLKALEEEKIDQLPGTAYAQGFLRSYADFLGLNVEKIVQRFRYEYRGENYKQKLLFPAPVPQSGVPAAVVILVGLVIIVGGYIGWYKMTDHQKAPIETIPSMVEKTEVGQGKISPQIASVMPSSQPDHTPVNQSVIDTINTLEKLREQDQKPNKPDIVPLEENKAANQEGASGDRKGGEQKWPSLPDKLLSDPSLVQQDKSATITKNTDQRERGEEADETGIVVKASAPSWIKAQDQNGNVLLQKTLRAGETWALPDDKARIVMTIGNAGAIVLEQGGKQSKPLGITGKVLRHFVITRQMMENLLDESSITAEKTGQATEQGRQ